MSGLSRRTLLTRGALAVAAGGVAAVAPALGSDLAAAQGRSPEADHALSDVEVGAIESGGPLVAHVTNVRTGEISVYQGESLVVYKDRSLAARLARAVPKQGK